MSRFKMVKWNIGWQILSGWSRGYPKTFRTEPRVLPARRHGCPAKQGLHTTNNATNVLRWTLIIDPGWILSWNFQGVAHTTPVYQPRGAPKATAAYDPFVRPNPLEFAAAQGQVVVKEVRRSWKVERPLTKRSTCRVQAQPFMICRVQT